MKQKIYTLAAIATLLLGVSAFAQRPAGAPQGGAPQMPQQITAEKRAEQLTSQMSERLNLDAKQKKAIEKINLTFARSLQANTPGAARSGAAMGGRPGGGMRGGGAGGGGGAGMGDMGGGGGGAGMGGMGGGIASPGGSFGNAPSQKTPADMQAARERAAETRAKKLEKILTPEQFKTWSAMEQERVKEEQERMANRGQRGPGGQQGGPQGNRPAAPPQR